MSQNGKENSTRKTHCSAHPHRQEHQPPACLGEPDQLGPHAQELEKQYVGQLMFQRHRRLVPTVILRPSQFQPQKGTVGHGHIFPVEPKPPRSRFPKWSTVWKTIGSCLRTSRNWQIRVPLGMYVSVIARAGNIHWSLSPQ